MNIIMDYQRQDRCGVEEAVYCEGKNVHQIEQIIQMSVARSGRLLLTRLSQEKHHQLGQEIKERMLFDPLGRTAVLGPINLEKDSYKVAIVSGGASDAPVCSEIATTLNYHGIDCERFEDLGVAALWRLQERLDEITKAPIIIAVAGMEAALPTVLAGMISNPIIAVPTSVGYGVSEGGNLALHSCLGSCAAGITTVNIDNGFGAACSAIKILKSFNRLQYKNKVNF